MNSLPIDHPAPPVAKSGRSRRRVGQAERSPTKYARNNGGAALRLSHPNFPNRNELCWPVAALIVALFCAAAARAERAEPLPDALKGVGVTEHLGDKIPLDLRFKDTDGRWVELNQFFDGRRPVLLTLNYSNCPMLCGLQLNGVFDALGKMPWDIGDRFQMITVGIDPLETPEKAGMTKQKYLQEYRRAGAAEGWRFLTTPREEDIKKLADSLGFRYRFEGGEYLHAAVTFILTPDGRISRYLYGVEYDPQTFRLSLLEAADGKIGTTVDRFLLFCFHYDAAKGRYGPAAFRLMQLGGGLTVLIVGGAILILRRREKRKRKEAA